MKFKKIIIFVLIALTNCENHSLNNKVPKKYKNSGFSLVFNENLYTEKLDNSLSQIFHNTLDKKALVKIINPQNNKYLIAEVKSNRVKFSNFYNSVISKKIVDSLELDIKEPFIEIILVSHESIFVADKAKTFEEEKEVAEKAPINGIKISNLIIKEDKIKKQSINKKFSYSIKVADFYYKKTAQLMLDRIKTQTSLKNLKIHQLSKTNYRVLIGPFNDIKSLQESFEKMNSLYFENLEILKNV